MSGLPREQEMSVTPRGGIGRELAAVLLVPALALGTWPVSAAPVESTAVATEAGAALDTSPDTPELAEAPAPPPVFAANRKLPEVEPVPAFARLSANPSRKELEAARFFSEPMLAIGGEPSAQETAAVGKALTAFQRRGNLDDTAALEALAQSQGVGPWRASLLLNLGLVYLRTNRFTRAHEALRGAWDLAKDGGDDASRAVANKAVGELARLHSQFIHAWPLEPLLAEVEGRELEGSSAERVRSARMAAEGLGIYHHRGVSTGVLALSALAWHTGWARGDDPRLWAVHGSMTGISLRGLRDLAGEVGLRLRMVHRDPGAPMITPAVMFLRQKHAVTVLDQARGRYRVAAQALGVELWMSPQALDEEASGYFLVSEDAKLPQGWTEAAASQADGENAGCVWIMPNRATCKNCTAKPGMATYGFMEAVAGLLVSDLPIGYQPAFGPAVQFSMTYRQWREEMPATYTFSNLGRRWSHAFMGWVEDDPSDPYASARAYRPGGGREDYLSFDGQAYAPERTSRAVLRRVSSSPISYERVASDGSKEVYSQPDGTATAPRRVFLTQVVDPQGNAVSLTYDSQLRLVAIQDALGLVTTLSYQHTDPLLITRVTDPFGRSAQFDYDANKHLSAITDVVGIVSSFEYGSSDFIRAMTTPYGTTRFKSDFDVLMNPERSRWWLEATDPLGGTERVEFTDQPTGLAASEPAASVPTGFSSLNTALDTRNSFYWDKRAWSLYPGDYSKAKLSHWLWVGAQLPGYANPLVSDTLHSEKKPLEGRVWYDYIEQGAAQTRSTFDLPVKVARVLDDGTSQIRRYEYNDQGKVTRATDPLGRVTLYRYAANGLDLLDVRQVNGAGFDLLTSSTYNGQHQPLTTTDAAGQTTTYTYDARGRLATVVTPPRNGPGGTPLSAAERTTTYAYYADNAPLGAGRLQSITGPSTAQGSPVTTYAYDSYGRVRTTTDADNYTLTYDYDALDRLTRVTYPDSTYEQTVYNRLDPEKRRDRLGRWSQTFHDALRRVVATRDPLARTVRQEWCGCGSLDRLIDANGNATTWERDAQGRVTREIRADGKDRQFVYESTTSRLKQALDFMTPRQVKNYEYFLDDSLKQVSYTNAVVPTPTVSYTYDPAYSRLATMTDGIGLTTYNYNPITPTPALGAGQLASVDGPLSNDTVSYSYDELGRIATRGLSGFSSTFKYDALGRLATQVSPVGNFTYGYDGVTGRALSLSYPNGQTSNYLYFANSGDHRLQEIKHLAPGGGLLSKFNYTYDVVGNIKTWRQEMAPDPAQVYELGYDLADQLTAATLKSTDPTPVTLKRNGYAFDPAGNRTVEQEDDAATGASYNNRNQLLSTQPGGTLLFRGSTSEPATVTVQGQTATTTAPPQNAFEKGAQTGTPSTNVVVQATDPSGNTRTNTYQVGQAGATTTYAHDANGNLISDGTKTYVWDAENRLTEVKQGATTLASFSYDGFGRRQQKTAGGVTRSYISDQHSVIEERVSTGQTRRYVEGETIDQHLAMQDGAAVTYYVADHLGSVVDETNSAGAVMLARRYDPWGNLLSGAGSAGVAFTGREWDTEAGLAYYRSRYYDPQAGRFISEDPLGFGGGTNYYAYVGGAPLNATDPFGQIEKPTGGKWCGSAPGQPKMNLSKPMPGTCNKVMLEAAIAGVDASQKTWCNPKVPAPSEDHVKKNAKAGIDEKNGYKTWYIPSGDPCIDYCRCEHETFHISQVMSDAASGRRRSRKELECEAYGRHKDCLESCK